MIKLVRERGRPRVAGMLTAGLLTAGCVLAGPAATALGSGMLYAAVTAAGAGTCADPADACTLDTALGAVAAGQTVQLTTPGDTARYVGNWTIATAGTSAGSPVTIEPAPGLSSAPILDGDGTSAPAGETCSTASCTGPVLTVPAGEYAGISGITIADGNNTSDVGGGGGLQVNGSVTVTGATFTANFADSDGGAIDSGDAGNGGGAGASVTVTGSAFTSNTALFGGGGAIDSGENSGGGGSVTVTGSSFSDNVTAFGDGAAIDSGEYSGGGSVTVTDSTFTGNASTHGSGGAIDSADNGGSGSVTVAGSTFTSNDATNGDGAAIDSGDHNALAGGSVTVTTSTFTGNTASDGGAIDSGDNSGNGSVSVTDSTFASNTAAFGGAIDSGGNTTSGAHGGSVAVSESTFVTNSANDGGAIDSGDTSSGPLGGGELAVWASTFTGNSATDGGVIDGGDNNGEGSVSVAADVFAGSCDQAGGSWTDESYNAGSDATCFSGNGRTRDLDAGSVAALALGPLASNGGPTQTVMPETLRSPVINNVPDPTAVTLDEQSVQLCPVASDQRGYTSASGASCDSGAVQNSGAATLALADSSPATGYNQVGDQITYDYQVTNSGTTSLTGVTVTDPAVSDVSCPDSTLGPGEIETCSGVYTVTSADIAARIVTDTAAAAGSTSLGSSVTSNSSTVTVRETWPSSVTGTYQPPAGSAEGYYLGLKGTAWRMVVTHPGTARLTFTGTITLNAGKFTGFAPIALEGGDSATVNNKKITFTFHNVGQVDGIKFSTTLPASSITFTLDINGQPAAASQIYLGSPPAQASTSSPLTFTR